MFLVLWGNTPFSLVSFVNLFKWLRVERHDSWSQVVHGKLRFQVGKGRQNQAGYPSPLCWIILPSGMARDDPGTHCVTQAPYGFRL